MRKAYRKWLGFWTVGTASAVCTASLMQFLMPLSAESIQKPAPVVSADLLESTGQVFEMVAEHVSPAVVYIESRIEATDDQKGSEESGSGILIQTDHINRPVVLTNYHVVGTADVKQVHVFLADGREVHPRRILRDPETDLAVLDLGSPDLPSIRIGNSDDVSIGQWVLAIGSPFGLTQSVTHGIISAKQRRQLGVPGNMRIKEFLQTDAAINPGNSGGPLVNLKGELIGINTAIASNTNSSSGVAFSIPANLCRWVANELVLTGKVRRAYLGVAFGEAIDFEMAASMGLPRPRGAIVGHVHPGTPAQRAGLQTNDVILSFDRTDIEDEHHLINTVSQTPIGKEVEIVIWRNRRQVRLNAVLGDWESFNTP